MKTVREVFEAQGEKDFELIIGDANGEILSADVPVRWCTSPKLLERMDAADVTDPHVLIIAVNRIHFSTNEVIRELIPLTEMKTYLRFNNAKEYHIMAWVVDGRVGRVQLKELFTDKIAGEYRTDLFTTDDVWKKDEDKFDFKILQHLDLFETRSKNESDLLTCACTRALVEVPSNAFGKEPPGWLKWYVNLWHSDKPVDECNYRTRKILAVFKLIPVSIYVFLRMMLQFFFTAIIYAFGYGPSTEPKYIFHPFDAPFKMPFNDPGIDENSFLYRGKDNDLYLSGLTFLPFVLICFGAILMMSFSFAITFIVFVVCTLGVIDLITFIISRDTHYARSFVGFTGRTFDMLMSKGTSGVNRMTDIVEEKGWAPNIRLGTIGTFATLGILATGYMLYIFYLAGFFWTALIMLGLLLLITMPGIWAMNHFSVNEKMNDDYLNRRELLCPYDHDNLNTKMDHMPIEQKPIRLIYKDFKHKVCKPMQW